jgi:mannose-1-phosphate guanylyltransferase
MAYVDQAFHVVEQDPTKVVMLGINPSEAEPEYGYIVLGKRLSGPSVRSGPKCFRARHVSLTQYRPSNGYANQLIHLPELLRPHPGSTADILPTAVENFFCIL